MNIRKMRRLLCAVVSVVMLAIPVQVRAATLKHVTFIDNGEKAIYTTLAETVKEFYDEIGVSLTPKDRSVLPYKTPITQNMKIEIIRGVYITQIIDGKSSRVKIGGRLMVGNYLAQIKEETGVQLMFDGVYTTILEDGDVLYFYTKSDTVVTTTHPYPYETEYVEVDFLNIGSEHVYQYGIPGLIELTERVIFESGDLVSREGIETKVLVPAVKEIVYVGTGISLAEETDTFSESFKYTEVYQMSSTAYTLSTVGKAPGSSGYGVTASGLYVERGLVAVDPDVIALGTRLYVEDYGFAIAADTGSGVNGLEIDLYVETLEEARAYGRKDLTVYVLE